MGSLRVLFWRLGLIVFGRSMQRLGSKTRTRGSLATALFVVQLSAAHALAQAPDVTGSYEPSAQRTEVKVNTWGEDCGTRPVDQVINESGKVVVKADGAHLSLKFATRTVRSNSCWSQNPSLTLVSATSANGNYRAECRTSAGDPKREIGRYTVSVGPGTLELLEESEYDWQLKASHCVAKVRVTQTLTSPTRRPSAEPKDAGARAATPPTPPPEVEAKCVPGPAARLRMRPGEARIAPGERVCFVVRVLDAAGCPLAPEQSGLELSLQHPPGVQGTLSGSCFKAAENAALAEGLFKVEAASGPFRAEASVIVAAPDLSDITARRGASGSNPSVGSGRSAETQYETGVRAVSKGSRDLVWLGVTIAALAALLAGAAVIALRAARKPKRAARPRTRSSFPESRPPAAPAAPGPKTGAAQESPPEPAGPGGPQRICPQCRRGYPPSTERCSADGSALLDYDTFVAGSAAKGPSRFCPECGEALSADAFFCGACGHRMTVR